jgi:hypothetical protein
MKTQPGGYKLTTLEAVMKYVGAIMAILYALTGIAILWKPMEFFNIPEVYSLPLGSILLVYGLFRCYRVYTKYFLK